jgi:hypothetical protein
MIQSPVRWGVGAAAITLLAACSTSTPRPVVTVTRTPTPTVTVTVSPTTTSAAPSTSPATHSPANGTQTDLPGTCDTLLDDGSVFDAAGIKPLTGNDAFVVGKPDPVIHRLAYLNCRYGVTGHGTSGTPPIEVGVSLYATSTEATDRIAATVDDYTAHGASVSSTQVLGQRASMITGGSGAGYDVPTLVVADGQRTVAVSIAKSVTSKIADAAIGIAKLALRRTAE